MGLFVNQSFRGIKPSLENDTHLASGDWYTASEGVEHGITFTQKCKVR